MNDDNETGRNDFTARPATAETGYSAADESYYPTKLAASDLGFHQIRRAIIERRWLILACMAIGLAVAVAVTMLMTPLFRAGVLLEINSPEVEILASDGRSSRSGRNQAVFLETQYGLLESKTLAQRVARELNLASNPKFANQEAPREVRLRQASGRLQAGLSVVPEKGSQLVRVYFTSPDPAEAAKIVNSFGENFIQTNLERGYDASSFARKFLEDQLASVKAELEASERAMNNYAQQSGVVTTRTISDSGKTVESASLEDATLSALNTALTDARIARVTAEQQYRQSQSAGPGATVIAGTAGLRQQRSELQTEYDQRLALFRADYPEMLEMKGRIDALSKAIADEAAQLVGGDLNTLRANFLSAQKAEEALEARVNSLKASVLSQRNQSIESSILSREVDTNRALYDALLQRYKEIGVTGGIGKSPVSLVDRARPPVNPFSPNTPLNLLAGLLLGTIIGLLLAVAFELIFDTVKLPDDVRQRMGMRLLGIIPETDEDTETIDSLEDAKSSVSEAYASVRTALQFIKDAGNPQTIFLTSTRPGEGKSTSSYGLARSFARIGKRTLLIDADMRRPTFYSEGVEDGGLMQLLSSDAQLADYVQPSGSANLSLLAAGKGNNNAAELLASARLETVISEARSQFDVVVIDGPPVIGLADAPLLASMADATLVIIESGGARIGTVNETINRLRSSQARIAGAVLTKFPAKLADDSYYYYYDYSYGKSSQPENADRRITLNRNGS